MTVCNVITINNLICLIIYVLKQRAQHILVWNNATPHIRKPSIIGDFPLCNQTTYSATRSRCPVYLFFILLDHSSKFFFTGHQPKSNADFARRVNHVKRLILTCLEKYCFSSVDFAIYGGLLRLQPSSLTHLPTRNSLCGPLTQWLIYHCIDVSFSIFVIVTFTMSY